MKTCNPLGRSTRARASTAGVSMGAVISALIVAGNPQKRICPGWPSEGPL